MPSPDEEKEKSAVWMAAAIVGGLWCACLVFGAVLVFRGNGEIATAGVFGDFFGAINALFSSAAVALAVWAVILQQKELKDTRAEFEKQTEIQNEHLRFLREERIAREKLFKQQNTPRLMLRDSSHGPDEIRAILINAGAGIYDLDVKDGTGPGPVEKCVISPNTILDRNEQAAVIWRLPYRTRQHPEGAYEVEFSYKTALDETIVTRLRIHWQLNA